MYEYAATIERVVDGDTLVLLLDLGFSVYRRERVRLRGVRAPERGTLEGERISRYVARRWAGAVCVVVTHRDRRDRYGRYLADVRVGDDVINDAIVRAIARSASRSAGGCGRSRSSKCGYVDSGRSAVAGECNGAGVVRLSTYPHFLTNLMGGYYVSERGATLC